MTSTHKDSLITGLPRNIQETLTNAESPFDIMVDYTNFWGRVSGFKFLKIDKVSILIFECVRSSVRNVFLFGTEQ